MMKICLRTGASLGPDVVDNLLVKANPSHRIETLNCVPSVPMCLGTRKNCLTEQLSLAER